MILEVKRQGGGVSAIDWQTGLDRKTVRKYLDRGLEAPVYGPGAPGDRAADRFQSYLAERLEAFPGLSARRLHREIKAMVHGGAYSTLTEHLRLIRPAVPRRFEKRFETPAGKQALWISPSSRWSSHANPASCARSGCSAWRRGAAAGLGGGFRGGFGGGFT